VPWPKHGALKVVLIIVRAGRAGALAVPWIACRGHSPSNLHATFQIYLLDTPLIF
jgi:hypothetical protein